MNRSSLIIAASQLSVHKDPKQNLSVDLAVVAEVAPPVEDSQDDGGKLLKHLIVKYEVPIQNVKLKFSQTHNKFKN